MSKPWRLAVVVVLALLTGFVSGYWVERQRVLASMPSPDIARAVHDDRANRFKSLPSRAKIAMLGDSLTSQGEWSELLGVAVANRGVGGDTTAQILARVSSVPASAGTVFLMAGINDIYQRRSVDDAGADTQRIVRALAPRKVIVQSVLYTTDPKYTAAITDLNERNRAFCATGACRYLELNDLFSRDGLLRKDMTIDGTHLVSKAYPLWAARVEAGL